MAEDHAPTDLLDLPGRIERQAEGCDRLGSPLYGVLLHAVADDVRSGGPAAAVLEGYEDAPADSAVSLRLMGGVHRLVLQRRAPELATYYPSVGGTADASGAWPALRQVLVDHRQELRTGLHQPPQTNEVGRAAALIGVLCHLGAQSENPLRLFEIGASAGLNLRADRFCVMVDAGRRVGPPGSPVVFRDAWHGQLPPLGRVPAIVERVGCDVAPIDPTTTQGRLTLTSYVWPDQGERLDRLRGALAVASEVPGDVRRQSARDLVAGLALVEGTTTLLWHSVMWQYLPAEEQVEVTAALERLGRGANATARLAHASLEPDPEDRSRFVVTLRLWPDDAEVIGVAHPHGVPVDWLPPGPTA